MVTAQGNWAIQLVANQGLFFLNIQNLVKKSKNLLVEIFNKIKLWNSTGTSTEHSEECGPAGVHPSKIALIGGFRDQVLNCPLSR